MNLFLLGMLLSMLAYIIIGVLISRKVRNANDFFVAGRQAPTFLLVGSLVASYFSTALYFGDAGEAFAGLYAPQIGVITIMVAGYILGGVFFGRYIRRSESETIPEFLGKRFNSRMIQKLAAVTELVTITVYMLATIQGTAILMTLVTGLDYNLCILTALITFTIMTVSAGSKGVLITDTIMFGFFTIITIIVILASISSGGGWFHVLETVAQKLPSKLAWEGQPGYLYSSPVQNFIWIVGYGIVWMSVCMVGPWQATRYLMAKNEHSVVRSSIIAAFFVFLLEFIVMTGAVMFNYFEPSLESQSHIIVWAATNLVPLSLGVIMLTGILAAGISSATTFLSIISSAVANDLMHITDGPKKIRAARLSIIIASAVILLLAVWNPPQVFWIMYLGATVIASSWLPVCLASIWSRRITKAGAFTGMFLGFVGCGAAKIYTSVSGIKPPVYLDSFFVGIALNILGIVIASALTKVTPEEERERQALFEMPESEQDPAQIRHTKRIVFASLGMGALFVTILLVFWVIPYTRIR